MDKNRMWSFANKSHVLQKVVNLASSLLMSDSLWRMPPSYSIRIISPFTSEPAYLWDAPNTCFWSTPEFFLVFCSCFPNLVKLCCWHQIQNVTHEIHCFQMSICWIGLENHPIQFCLHRVQTFFETLFVLLFTRWMKTGRTGTESRRNMNSVPPLKLVLCRRTMLNVF